MLALDRQYYLSTLHMLFGSIISSREEIRPQVESLHKGPHSNLDHHQGALSEDFFDNSFSPLVLLQYKRGR